MNTTGLVMTVTDELLAELEELAFECNQHGGNWYEPRHMAAFPEYSCDQDFVVSASPETITALTAELRRMRAENAELAKDAGRLEELAKQANVNCRNTAYYLRKHRPDLATICSGWCDAIDTAMATQ